MKKIVVFLILLSFAAPVPARAGLETGIDPVEQPLIEKQKQIEKQRLEEDMSREFKIKQADDKKLLEDQMTQDMKKKQAEDAKKIVEKEKPATTQQAETSGSNWWKWALGILVVGGIAAAAGGGGGGGGGGGSSGGGPGSIAVSW